MQNSEPKGPPSKRKYLEKNPVVSFHLPVEDRDKLKEMAKRDGVKISTYYRKVARGIIAKDDDIQKSNEAACEEGRKAGYEKAMKEFMITLPCDDCGMPAILIPGTRAHDKLSRDFFLGEWVCKECAEKRRKSESSTYQE